MGEFHKEKGEEILREMRIKSAGPAYWEKIPPCNKERQETKISGWGKG